METDPQCQGRASLLILAGGASRRMGFPKALAEIDGEKLLVRHINRGLSLGLNVYVVLGANAELIGKHIVEERARVFINPSWREGQSSSLSVGLGEAAKEGLPCFVTPVDCPPVQASVYNELLGVLRQQEGAIVGTFQGKGGHPVLLSRGFVDAFLGVLPPPPLNQFMADSSFPVFRVAVDDIGILQNLNHPEELERYVRSRASR